MEAIDASFAALTTFDNSASLNKTIHIKAHRNHLTTQPVSREKSDTNLNVSQRRMICLIHYKTLIYYYLYY